MTPNSRLQSRGFRKPAERVRQRDKDLPPQKCSNPGSFEGGVTGPRPKTEPKRNPALLEMARGMQCLLRVPGVCVGGTESTVACHSNLSVHGKAGARKADDCYTVWGCAACHRWLDQGPAPAAEKEVAFMTGHLRQVGAWRGIAAFDPFLRDKNAAQWALDQLGATPVGDVNV